ncbi:MAG: CHASE domain-containing protein [Noviherbaspirillum sp.]
MCLGMTAAAWHETQKAVQQDTRRDFDYQARRIETLLQQRMATYEQLLRGAQGFMGGRTGVDRGDLAGYVGTLRLEESFPGIQGIAIAELLPESQRQARVAALRAQGLPGFAVRPDGERPVYSAIVQSEPANRMTLRALGYDMLTDPVRRAAMERARDSGVAALTGRLRLVQEGPVDAQNGVIVYLPVYGRGLPVATMAERRTSLVAWIGGPFRMADLMRGLLGDLRLQIFDGDGADEQQRLYDSAAGGEGPARPLLEMTRRVRIADREWILAI